MMHRTSAVIAKEMFELVEGSRNVGVTLAIDDVKALLRVRVVKMEMMDGLELRRGSRTGAEDDRNYKTNGVDPT